MKYLLFILSLILSSEIYPQTFTKELKLCGATSFGYSLIEDESGDLIVFGGDTKCLYFLKLDEEGQEIALIEKEATDNELFYALFQNFIHLEKDTFLLAFGKRTTRDNKTADIYLLKFSGETFDTFFYKQYADPDFLEPSSVMKEKFGYRILSDSDSIGADNRSKKSKLLFLDVDHNGKEIRRTYWDDSYRASFRGDFHRLANGNTAFGYKTGNDVILPRENLVIVDSSFNFVWEKGVSDNKINKATSSLVVSKDSSIFYYASEAYSLSFPLEHGHVAAYDLDGNQIWEIRFPEPYFMPLNMVRAKNGDLIGCGRFGKRGRIFRLDINGNVVFDRAYTLPDREFGIQEDYSEFFDVKEAKDGSILVSGLKQSLNWELLTYILKLDSSGCLVPSCDSISYEIEYPVNTTDVITTPDQIRVVPNPADEVISFQLPTAVRRPKINIVNAMGQIVAQQKELDVPATLKVGHLPKGIYFFEVLSADSQRIGSGRFVVER